MAPWRRNQDAGLCALRSEAIVHLRAMGSASQSPPTHSHPVEEVLTVLAGEADMWIDDWHATLAARQSLLIPAHRKHGFRNAGTDILHIHAVLSSPIFEMSIEGRDEPVRRWLGD
jgi:mannose-6-phosphate isomerase-like protein (cupin superfamily)